MLLYPNAKINLGLNVTGRRPDGYHDIQTVMIPIPSFDILEITPSPSSEAPCVAEQPDCPIPLPSMQGNPDAEPRDTLKCTGLPIDCPMEKNLVIKALRAMREMRLIPFVDISLCKQTPDGAGLGGGSADAAYMLKGLNELFELGMADKELAQIAARVGADCPFFIYNRPMLCTGTGTDMTPIPLELPADTWIAVVKPPVGVSTAEAYAGVTPKQPEHSITEILRRPADEWQGLLVNDFEPSVIAKYPVIGQIKQTLIDSGAYYAAMSGSGSAVFGLFHGEVDPEASKHLAPLGCYLIRKLN